MSRFNHLLDCIYKYYKDTGKDAPEIRITESSLRDLRREVATQKLYPIGQDPRERLVILSGLLGRDAPLTFCGVPLVVIPDGDPRQEAKV